MPARTYPRRTPAAITSATAATGAARGAGGTAVTRLPWWAVVLPVLAFAVLFGLIAGGGEAHATDGDPAVGRILERIQHTLAR
ncbi:hypothetical protein ACPCSC_18275 [Streptomyces lavendulocolor]|uniref:hypothetical protein n=1 Tax=Streptomyces lavendulocolor TaxID=67316 RepID=UPI003C2D53BD